MKQEKSPKQVQEYTTPEQVHKRALEAVGRRIGELSSSSKGQKNQAGDAFEAFFGKKKDSSSQPDLPKANVELKATPIRQKKDNSYSAKERLVLTIINYYDIVHENFLDSHFLQKNGQIEIAFYEYKKDTPTECFGIKNVFLYIMKNYPEDFRVIQHDWETIQKYVKDGHAEELSESLTDYLGACTKGADSSSVRSQPFSHAKAKQRAFDLKTGYMTRLYNSVVLKEEAQSLLKGKNASPEQLAQMGLDNYILGKFRKYVGWTIDHLIKKFKLPDTIHSAKQRNYAVAAALLGLENKDPKNSEKLIKSTEEIEKANIKVKTVQFDYEGRNKESMSLPAFKFKELVQEKWTDDGMPSAELNKYLSENKFLFFVVQKDANGNDIFRGVKFFAFPPKLIETEVRDVWQDTIDKLDNGVELKYVKKQNTVHNNFIKQKDHRIIHVRPHAPGRGYCVCSPNADELPKPAHWIGERPWFADENHMTTSSFWINSEYVREQVKDLLDLGERHIETPEEL